MDVQYIKWEFVSAQSRLLCDKYLSFPVLLFFSLVMISFHLFGLFHRPTSLSLSLGICHSKRTEQMSFHFIWCSNLIVTCAFVSTLINLDQEFFFLLILSNGYHHFIDLSLSISFAEFGLLTVLLVVSLRYCGFSNWDKKESSQLVGTENWEGNVRVER